MSINGLAATVDRARYVYADRVADYNAARDPVTLRRSLLRLCAAKRAWGYEWERWIAAKDAEADARERAIKWIAIALAEGLQDPHKPLDHIRTREYTVNLTINPGGSNE